jgi:hypothetical protein
LWKRRTTRHEAREQGVWVIMGGYEESDTQTVLRLSHVAGFGTVLPVLVYIIPRHPLRCRVLRSIPFHHKKQRKISILSCIHYSVKNYIPFFALKRTFQVFQVLSFSNTYRYARGLRARMLSASARTTFSSLKSTQELAPSASFSVRMRMCAT